MDVDNIRVILKGKEKDKKVELLTWLWDYFESYVFIDNINSVVNLLINCVIDEEDLEVKEKILDTIQIASTYRNLKECDFYLLENNIDTFSDDMILIIIAIFEATYNKRFNNILEKLINNTNPNISREAKEALAEIKCNLDK